MTHVDTVQYPKFAQYVRVELPKVAGIKAIAHAMATIGQLDKAHLKRALAWGYGPDIKITPLVGAYGEFTPDAHSNEIRIDKHIVDEFEAGRGRKVAKAGKVYLVGVTLLHELVHWGDDKDGVDRPGEEGEEFERAVYGGVIG